MVREFRMEDRSERPRRDRDNSRREERRGSRIKRDEPREFDMSSRNKTQFFEATCDKCGKKCDLPFRPTGSKPVYCRDCFKNADLEQPSRSSGEISEIHKKSDKIMKALHIYYFLANR